jgi:hypothetical protein
MTTFKDIDISSGGKFLKFKDGENVVRIVSELLVYWISYDKTSKTWSVYATQEAASQDKEARKRYACWVIDRETGSLKIMQMGNSIVGAIKALATSKHYAFDSAPDYDIAITRTGSDLLTKYSVTPLPKSPLTEDEKAMVEKNAIDLRKYIFVDGTVDTSQPF